ncbi:multiple sugar transport system substrate-binding protein [Caldalkalibacillus uzonensis]|uniref:Multiple sugar transport system substrate-binding protein n=1 Tax=Caldalkalibacillus uzonensis TaxID=353224 RepID=A0ABU0CQC3_9BACI|nr:ABC transporter substrate-binding protein [Caldalkalibacillus uzonensis]MDQ0338585.1 multiple sugar transport system substrate-binding protein [Caldalkalibacillus uzonensis]
MKIGKIFGLALILLLLLTACGQDTDSSSGETSNGDSTEIKVWHYFTGKQQTEFEKLAEEYNKLQDKVKVVMEYVPFDETKKQLSIGVAGETLPDIVFMDGVDNASFAAIGVLEDLTDRIQEWGQAENYYEGPLNSTKYNGRYYGLPYESNTLALFYNKDMFEKAGIEEPPATWEELRETAKKLTDNEHYGFAISAVRSEESTFQFYPFLISAGGDYQNINSPEAVKAITLFEDLLKDGSMSKDVVNATQDDIAKQFAAGRVAMMINGPWNITRIKEDAPDLNFGIAMIPKDVKSASVLGGGNLTIVKGKNVDEAWEFLKWLQDPKQLEPFASSTNIFPPRKDVLETSEYWKGDQYLSEFIPIMDVAVPRGPSPEWPEISSAIQVAIQQVLTESQSPQEAFDEAAVIIDSIIGK